MPAGKNLLFPLQNRDDRSPPALPMILYKEIEAIGFALARDFINDNDSHRKIFKTINELAAKENITPYHLN